MASLSQVMEGDKLEAVDVNAMALPVLLTSPTATLVPESDEDLDKPEGEPESYPPAWKQIVILLTLNLAMAIDVISSSALFVVVAKTAEDLHVTGGDKSWILTSYAITFAAFQLSMGRLADLSAAGWIFIIGIGMVSTLNLVLSFVNNAILFFVLRAIQGIAAAMTIPSSYNIVVRTFAPGKGRNRALAILGLVGSVSYSLGVIVGGAMEQISWRWLLRLVAIFSFIATGLALLIVPKGRASKRHISLREIISRLDLVGLTLSVSALVLFVFALTSGPQFGWSNPKFSATLPVSAALFIGFFVWEGKFRDEHNAMLPAIIWKTPTVKPLVFLNLCPFIFWPTTSFGFPTYWQETLNRTALESAIRLLPVGVSALVSSIVIQLYPGILTYRRWPLFVSLPIVAGLLPMYVYSGGAADSRYWSLCVPAFAIGSVLCQYTFLAINVFVITSVDPKRAGVTGALMSVVMQLGGAVGLAVQTACLNQGDSGGTAAPWSDYARGYWAVMGWILGSVAISGSLYWYETRYSAKKMSVSHRVEDVKDSKLESSDSV